MNKRFMNIVILIIFLIISWGNLFGQTITVRVTEWPPQYFQNNQGVWTGVDVELVKAIIDKAGYKINFIEYPWSRALEELKRGGIDLILSFAKTEEREEYARYIGSHRNITISLIVKSNTDYNINSLDDFITVSNNTGKEFGNQANTSWSTEFNERLESDATFANCFFETYKGQSLLDMTKAGRILGFFEDKGNMSYRINNDTEYNEITIHPFVLDTRPTYIGASKKLDINIFNKLVEALNALQEDGTLRKIQREWGY